MVPIPTPIYHITDLTNMQSILDNNGLHCTNVMETKGIRFTDIAYDNIQTRRSKVLVPLEPLGYLHDYVPFYFAPRSPMLYTINLGNVPQHKKGQGSIIYLASTVETVMKARIPFVFTDGHAAMYYSDFYNSVDNLDQVDWNVMSSRYWNDTDEYPDRKRKRQAEFLVFESFPIHCITEVGVINSNVKMQIDKIFSANSVNIPVNARLDWYY